MEVLRSIDVSQESGGISDKEDSKENIESAYKLLQKDRALISLLCKGNLDIADEVIGAITEKIVQGKVDINVFLEAESYRKKIYKNALNDFFRKKKGFNFNVLEDDVVDLDSKNPESLLVNKEELAKYMDELLNPDNLKSVFTKLDTRTKVIYIINGILEGKNSNKIAEELSITESYVSLLLATLKKSNLGGVYDLFFEYFKKFNVDKVSISKVKKVRFEQKMRVFRETLIMLLEELKAKKIDNGTLAAEEEKMLIAVEVFLDSKIKGTRRIKIIIDKLKERGWVVSVHAVYALQKKYLIEWGSRWILVYSKEEQMLNKINLETEVQEIVF